MSVIKQTKDHTVYNGVRPNSQPTHPSPIRKIIFGRLGVLPGTSILLSECSHTFWNYAALSASLALLSTCFAIHDVTFNYLWAFFVDIPFEFLWVYTSRQFHNRLPNHTKVIFHVVLKQFVLAKKSLKTSKNFKDWSLWAWEQKH